MVNIAQQMSATRVYIGAEIPADLKTKLDAVAAHEDASFSHVVRKCLRLGVAHFAGTDSGIKVSIHCAPGSKRAPRVARKPSKQ